MSNLSQNTILITGASRGLGRAIAKKCADAGAKLVLHYGSNQTAMDQVASELGDAILGTIAHDLSTPMAGAALWDKAMAIAPNLNALINNAAIAEVGAFEGSDEDWMKCWQRTLAVNLHAPADLCRAAITHFDANQGGGIVNITSRAAQRGDKMDFSAYAASKAGLTGFTQTIAKGCADRGIYAYCIAPGWIETEMAPTDPAIRGAAVAETPIGRFAEPSEIASLAAFLLSGDCQSATGATFDVNGASHLR